MVSRRAFLSGTAGLAVAGSGVDALLVEPRALRLTEHDLAVPGLPAALEGWTIAQLTDVHLTRVHAAARRCAALLDALKPDVVLLTGDIVEGEPDLAELTAWLPEVSGVRATLASFGNWEHWGGLRASRLGAAYSAAGVQLLTNEAASIETGSIDADGAKLSIVGLDDGYAGAPDPAGALRGASGDATIWLAHAPVFVDDYAASPLADELPAPDLVLSGHTHGGQIRHPFGPIVTPPGSGRFVRGWYRDTFAPLYVSQGVGTSIVPARFLCRPEVAVFTLRRA